MAINIKQKNGLNIFIAAKVILYNFGFVFKHAIYSALQTKHK